MSYYSIACKAIYREHLKNPDKKRPYGHLERRLTERLRRKYEPTVVLGGSVLFGIVGGFLGWQVHGLLS